ncbi:acyl-CoA dehydrogenase family protein [Yinghuangia sp. YIM S09857]|uniref:acyl-CoA dehydrogenase family protein n=1 Tax=Yinghuangia sp. YIM S09857 TaxID=3436929 RepID=UPI003F5389DF
MQLTLDDEQEALRRAFAELFARESSSAAVRATEPTGFSPGLWEVLKAAGATDLGLPDEVGGADAALGHCVVIAEEAGRRVAPVPLAEHTAATRAVAHAGEPGPLAVLAAEPAPITLALRPVGHGPVLVPAGSVAGQVLVLDAERAHLLLIPNDTPPPAVPNLASLPLAEHRFAPADTPGVLVADDARAHALFAAAVDDWRLLTAAALVGLADEALARTVEYVCDRRQFGRPIGSFQALQHGLAEMPGRIAGARLLTARAAWSSDNGHGDAGRLARTAFLFAAETARMVTSKAIHYHGGYGVMEEHDIQMYYRRAKGWPLVAGDPAAEYRRLADVLYGPAKGQ